jgi:hypothetical protein
VGKDDPLGDALAAADAEADADAELALADAELLDRTNCVVLSLPQAASRPTDADTRSHPTTLFIDPSFPPVSLPHPASR